MKANKLRKASDDINLTFGPDWAGIKVDREDDVIVYNSDGTKRGVQAAFGMSPVNVTAATLTVTQQAHAGKTITLDVASGVTVTLPAATGTGDTYTFVVKTAATSNQHRINVTGDDAFFGNAWFAADGGDTVVAFEAGSDADQINLNGTTTGGTKGAMVRIIDVATDIWSVNIWSAATGTEATPFSTGQVS